jgi:NADP-dependent 3-hydroxy acid dehydrogenase YdfG
MTVALDKKRFGPWALVTGASSGIGKEFAQQIAASGINVVLVARREALLAELGRAISQEFDVQYRAVAMDLSQEGFIAGLADATDDIDIGLVVSNAGTPNPGEFLKLDRQLLQATLRLNTMAHLDITHHFGAKLAERRRGGLILIGSVGAEIGVPFLANDGGAKAYVHSLGEAPLRVQASGRLRYRRAAPADKHGGAGQAWVRPADHADEADERGAVRIRRSERVTGKPLQDHPWSAAPHHECVGARFRETDDDSQDARQNACEQARARNRSGGGLRMTKQRIEAPSQAFETAAADGA